MLFILSTSFFSYIGIRSKSIAFYLSKVRGLLLFYCQASVVGVVAVVEESSGVGFHCCGA